MLQLIHKIHWGETGPADPSTLQYAADRWARSRVVQPNDFQALEDLIIHSYQARVVGTWIRLLRRQKFNPERVDSTVTWLEEQISGESGSWMETLNRISSDLHASLPSTRWETRPPSRDQEFENHQHYCAHVELYLTIRYAIKHADIGLLRYALRHVTIIFQASAAGTPKYAQALLHTLHTIDSPAATIKLQDAILMNGLANLRGDGNSNFETDRLLELLNNNLKAFQQERSYLSKNSDTLLENWALNHSYLLSLKEMMQTTFGINNSSKHPVKSAAEDIWSMAITLASQSLCKRNNDRFTANTTINLHIEGLKALSGNVFKYNQKYFEECSFTDDMEETYVSEFMLLDSTSQTPPSPTLPASIIDVSDEMFVD
jgi:hypothetical protein